MKIKIIGDGAWGSALHTVLKRNSQSVSFWEIGEPIDDPKVVVLSVPTQAIRSCIKSINKTKKRTVIVNSAKGIERKTHKLPFQIVQEILGNDIDYFSIMGPSFAQEVAAEMPTLVNLGYVRERNKEVVKNLFQTDYFRVRPTRGVEALELAAALKNVYAIACGMAEGLGFGMNTRTKLILLAIEEFYRLSKKMGYKIEVEAAPGTLGDLVLTCSSVKSRNFTFGKKLTKYHVEECLERIKTTVEGYYTVSSLRYFVQKTGVKLPLATLVAKIIAQDKPREVRGLFANFVKQT